MVELSLCHGDALSRLDWRLLVFVGYFWFSSAPKNSENHDSNNNGLTWSPWWRPALFDHSPLV